MKKIKIILLALFVSSAALGIFGSSTIQAAPQTHDYDNWGLASAQQVGYCRTLLTGGTPPVSITKETCANTVDRKCKTYRTEPYRSVCRGSFFQLRKCTAPLGAGASAANYNACLDRNTFICASVTDSGLQRLCQAAGRSEFYGIRTTTTNESGEPSTTVDGGNQSSGASTIPTDSVPTEAEAGTPDESFTEEELAQQRIDAQNELAKGTNTCGDSSTVFDFGCDSGVSNPIIALIFAIIKFVTFGIGILLTLSLIISGIQYTTAQGDANTVHKARLRIFNTVIALLLYIFAFAILNYLVPGGLIN